jgi:hypothetical protein
MQRFLQYTVLGFIKSIFHTDKKENEIFLMYKEIQIRSVAKGFLIYEEIRKYLTMYEEAVSHSTLQPIPS